MKHYSENERDKGIKYSVESYKYFQKNNQTRDWVNLYYSLEILGHDIRNKRKKVIVYCVDSVEFWAHTYEDDTAYSNYVFNGMLDQSMSDDTQNEGLFTLADAAGSFNLFTERRDGVLLTCLAPHAEEVSKIPERIRSQSNELYDRVEAVVKRLAGQKVSKRQLERIEKYILSADSAQESFRKFIEDFDLVLPHSFLALIRRSSTAAMRLRKLISSPLFRQLSEGPLSVFQSIDKELSLNGNFIDKDKWVEIQDDYQLVLTFMEESIQLAGQVSSSLISDCKALALCTAFNNHCERHGFDAEFRMLSRSPYLTILSSAVFRNVVKATVIHPFFCPELYGARKPSNETDVWRSSMHMGIAKTSEEIQEYLGTVIKSLLNPVTANVAEDLSTRFSELITTELKISTSALGSTMSGLMCSWLGLDNSRSEKFLENMAQRVEQPVSNSEIRTFFEIVARVMVAPSVADGMAHERALAESLFYQLSVSQFKQGDPARYYVYIAEQTVHIRLGWGYMRTIFEFQDLAVCNVILQGTNSEIEVDDNGAFTYNSDNSVPEVCDRWIVGHSTANEFFDRLANLRQSERYEQDECCRKETVLLSALIVAATGNFAMGARHISQNIPSNGVSIDSMETSFLKSEFWVRESYLLRHFCCRASAFDSGLFFGGKAELARARRDLHYARLVDSKIRTRLGKAKHPRDDSRIVLGGIGLYLETAVLPHRTRLQSTYSASKIDRTSDNIDTVVNLILEAGVAELIQTCFNYRQSLNHETELGRYRIVRVNQVRLTVFLFAFAESTATIQDVLSSTIRVFGRSELLALSEFSSWLEDLKAHRLTSAGLVSINVTAPVVEFLEMLRKLDSARCDDPQNRVSGRDLGDLAIQGLRYSKKLNTFLEKNSGARFRIGGFYYEITRRAANRLEAISNQLRVESTKI